MRPGCWSLPSRAVTTLAANARRSSRKASDFAVTFNTYTIEEKADYQRRMKSLMTPSYYKEFTKITDAMFGAIEDKKQSSGDAKVLATAVDSIDEDSAVVLVAVNAAVKSSGRQGCRRTSLPLDGHVRPLQGRVAGPRVRRRADAGRRARRADARARTPREATSEHAAAAAPPPHRGRVEARDVTAPKPSVIKRGRQAPHAVEARSHRSTARRQRPEASGSRGAAASGDAGVRPRPPSRAPDGSACRACPDGSAVLVALTVVAVVFGAVFGIRGVIEWRDDNSIVEAHEKAATAAASAGETIFTYQYNQLDEHLKDAKATMTPTFAKKFESIAPALQDLAPQRKIQVKATVRNAAAEECGDKCSPDRATMLVFIDQARVADGAEKPTVFGNRIELMMVERDGRWLVDEIKAL